MSFLSKLFGKPKTAPEQAKATPQLTPELIARFEALKKLSISIEATAVEMGELALGESRFGGMPDVPDNFSWPAYKGKSFPFIAQINFCEVTGLDGDHLLPPDGYLLIFYEGGSECWGFRPDDHKYWKFLYVPAGTALRRQPPPPIMPEWPTIRPGKLSFAKGFSYADAWDWITKDWTREERDLYCEYKDSLKLPDARHQLLGHSRNVQNDMKIECQLTSNGIDCGGTEGYRDPRRKNLEPGARDWMLLLQFDSDDGLEVMWGDVGTIYVWIRKQDLAAKEFEAARICFQCS